MASTYPDDGKVISYGDSNEMPEKARPNAATISLYEVRKKVFIDVKRRQGQLYTVKPKGSARKFIYENNLPSSKLEKELSEGYLLSYLYYDNGIIKYDGFKKDINNIKALVQNRLFRNLFSFSLDIGMDWTLTQ